MSSDYGVPNASMAAIYPSPELSMALSALGHTTVHDVLRAGVKHVSYRLAPPLGQELFECMEAYRRGDVPTHEDPAPDNLPNIEVLQGVLKGDWQDLKSAIIQAIQLQDDIKWAKVQFQGSDHKESAWYRTQGRGPRIDGLQYEIGALLAMYNLRGVRLEDYDVYEVRSESVQLSKTRLLDLGVDPEIISQATVRTPYTAIVVKRNIGKRKTK